MQSLNEFINNPHSMTQALKKIKAHFSLKILQSFVQDNIYTRIIVISLDNIPVLIGKSTTHINNQIFLHILTHSKECPIGTELFKPQNQIIRNNIQITHVSIDETKDNYLTNLDPQDIIIKRESQFMHKAETMYLTEYILPGIRRFFN